MNVIIKAGKRLNFIKKMRRAKEARYLSCVRRIERVHPIPQGRVCAMTFDDGPCALPPAPNFGTDISLTEHLVNTLREYDACGTFNIIGDTSDNYPDKEGALHGPYWGGERFDHYPAYDEDDKGGSYHHPELVELLIKNKNELSNHCYLHRLFGKKRAIYAKRAYLDNFDSVVNDLKKLHELILKNHGYTMKLSRPPHYIDNIAGGYDSYHAYQLMNYQYLSASFDGGGWLASTGDYKRDVEMMLSPMKSLLDESPDALNGQIIFQKDGFNMSKQTPVATALKEHLDILTSHGYKVVTVSELLRLSPVRDMPCDHPDMESLKYLIDQGHAVCYRNNEFRPDLEVSMHELLVMLCPRSVLDEHLLSPYAAALEWAKKRGVTVANASESISREDLKNILKALDVAYDTSNLPRHSLKRKDVLNGICEFVKASGI